MFCSFFETNHNQEFLITLIVVTQPLEILQGVLHLLTSNAESQWIQYGFFLVPSLQTVDTSIQELQEPMRTYKLS